MWAKCAANRGRDAYGGEASIGTPVDGVKARMLSMDKEKATDADVDRCTPPSSMAAPTRSEWMGAGHAT